MSPLECAENILNGNLSDARSELKLYDDAVYALEVVEALGGITGDFELAVSRVYRLVFS